jgi:glutamate synthase (NADPH/NADH) small chain
VKLVGRDVTGDALLAEFEAVFIAPGLGGDSPLGIPRESGPGVSGAVAWIERLKLEAGYTLAGVKRAVVIGGGNTAIDAARELAKSGVADVTLLYRRTEAEMSGYAHELEHARAEGVHLIERAVPASFQREAGVLRALRLVDGREFPCDLALVAIGQARPAALVAAFPGVALDAKGRIVADRETGRTGHAKVWAGGDTMGGELVVTAVQDGKRAARSIARTLGLPERPDSPMLAGHR